MHRYDLQNIQQMIASTLPSSSTHCGQKALRSADSYQSSGQIRCNFPVANNVTGCSALPEKNTCRHTNTQNSTITSLVAYCCYFWSWNHLERPFVWLVIWPDMGKAEVSAIKDAFTQWFEAENHLGSQFQWDLAISNDVTESLCK